MDERDIDIALEHEQRIKDKSIAAIRNNQMVAGHPGDCDMCGEHFSRLVNGACGGCRDKYKLD